MKYKFVVNGGLKHDRPMELRKLTIVDRQAQRADATLNAFAREAVGRAVAL